MSDILKIASVLIIMIFLLKRKWNLGIVMALSSVILAVFYMLAPIDFLNAFYIGTTDKTTISLILALTLIRIFEIVMRMNGIMQKMMDSFRGMVMDRRALMASMPALIGILPSMGGALFSAPMVDEASKGINISPEKKAFVNYMFRHPWEFILPLYPGIILCSAITAQPLRNIILANLPFAMCLVLGGTVWGLSGVGSQKEGFKIITRSGLLSFFPIALILFMVIGLHLNLSLSLGVIIIGMFAVLRYSPKNILQTLKEGLSWEIILIILGVMTFKGVLNVSGAVTNISAFFSSEGIPVLPILFFLPFIYGLLTGLTVGFVGSTFPILLGLENTHHLGAISFAFASGYVGVLLSPVHLCLVLTREYFKAEMHAIYRKIFSVCILIMSVALMEYFILSRYLLAR
ncbi:MAG: DUF401 family protein [Nitrospiraceae bacterium]|nr:MAG: DUF401 family protein [Nitrospiraceae bacterium]